jgi:uncharacterized protein (TIRG00374 family)
LVVIHAIAMNRWKLFLKHSGIEEGFFTLAKISFMSTFMGIALPSSQGGDVARMYFIEKRHQKKTEKNTASSSVIIERMLGFVLLAFIGLISSILVPDYPNKEKVVILISLINIFIYSAIFVLTNKWCYKLMSRLLLKVRFFTKVTGFVERTHFSLAHFPYKKVLLPSLILIFLLQCCTILVAYFVFLSFAVDLPFYQHLSFYPIITILSVIPISISGLGLRESFFVYFYALVGVAPEIAVGVSLMNYVVEVLSAALVGGVLYMLYTMKIIKI